MMVEELPKMVRDSRYRLLDTFDGVKGGKLYDPVDDANSRFSDAKDALYKLKNKTRVLTHAGNDGMISVYTDDSAFYRAEFSSYGATLDSVITGDDDVLVEFINKHIDSCDK